MRIRSVIAVLMLGAVLGYFYQAKTASDAPQQFTSKAPVKTKSTVASKDKAILAKKIEHITEDSLSAGDLGITSADGLLAYLSKQLQQQARYSFFRDKELRVQLKNHPSIIPELFVTLTEIEDSDLRDGALEVISLSSLFSKNESLPILLLEKLQSGDKYEDWLLIGSQIGLRSESLTKFLVEQLPSSSQPSEIRASINLMSSNFDDRAQIISLSLRNKAINTIASFKNHASSQVRASVVASYNRFPPRDSEIELLAAMQDSSSNVRIMAMQVASQSQKNSAAIKDHMLSIVADPNARVFERQSAAFALQAMPLDALELATSLSTIEEVDAYVQSLPLAEREKLFEEYRVE